jgi:hypothetical protein
MRRAPGKRRQEATDPEADSPRAFSPRKKAANVFSISHRGHDANHFLLLHRRPVGPLQRVALGDEGHETAPAQTTDNPMRKPTAIPLEDGNGSQGHASWRRSVDYDSVAPCQAITHTQAVGHDRDPAFTPKRVS